MKGNLLIVDDEIALSENMKELLEEEANEIFLALNGKEALAIIQKHKIDCVVSDIRMPVMDGLTFIRQAREEGYDVPVIFYSGHGCEELKKTATEMGALDLFQKPNYCGLEKLVRKVLSPTRNAVY